MVFEKNEVAILRRAERSMVRVMCSVKLVDMLGLKEAADKLARANGVQWYGHVLRQPDEDVLMKVMVHEVYGKKPTKDEKEQVEEKMRRIGLKKEDAADLYRWRKDVGRIAEVVRCIWPPPFTEYKLD